MSEQQIRATFDRFAHGWNVHDPAAMAACWTENGTVIDIWGRFVAGRAAIAEFLRSEHESLMRESTYRLIDLHVQSISDTSAVIKCDALIDGVLTPNGRRYELPHQVDGVLLAGSDGQWLFATLHPSFKRGG